MRLRVIAQTEADYDAWVAAAEDAALAAPRSPSSTRHLGQVGLPVVPLGHEPRPATSSATIGPNLTHVGDREAFAGDIYQMTLDNLTKWVYDAPGRKPAGAAQGLDAQLLRRTA